MPESYSVCSAYHSRGKQTSVADHVVGGYVCDWLGSVSNFSVRCIEETYTIVVGRADACELALVDTIDIELLEDGVGRSRSDKKKDGKEVRSGFHDRQGTGNDVLLPEGSYTLPAQSTSLR